MSYVKTLSVQQRQDASAAIRKLLEEGPVDEYWGVCFNLHALLDSYMLSYTLVESLQDTWPSTTGNKHYPVPGCYHVETLWKGEQLTLRRSLLKHMLAELELAE